MPAALLQRRSCCIALALGGLALWRLARARRGTPSPIDGQLDTAAKDLLQAAEAQLAAGDAQAALVSLEQAAGMVHDASIEIVMVRARLQRGEYRQALAFAAHANGAHRESAPAAALYAMLLAVGGQHALAQRVLDEARRRLPGDAEWRGIPLSWLDEPAQDRRARSPQAWVVGPVATMADTGQPPGPSARAVGNATLLPGGARALTPVRAADGRARLWLRDAMGRTAAARVLPDAAPDGLVRLQLQASLDAGLPFAPRDPFAGSPAFAFGFAAQPDATAAWPWMGQGFIGAGPPSLRLLGFALPVDSSGGPVLDAFGRLAGVALRGVDGRWRWVPQTLLRRGPTLVEGQQPLPRIGADEAYERAMRISLQVIVEN